MTYINDFFKVLALLLLLLGSVQPVTIGILQNRLQSVDYSQFTLVQTLQSDLDLTALMQLEDVSHPIAVVLSVLLALYINKFVQVCLYQIHLLVYEFSPLQTLWIVLENIWNFIFCVGSPIAIAKVTHLLTASFLTRFCDIPAIYIDIAAGVLAICLLLATFAITEQYVEQRTYEIELMATPPNLNPNNYSSNSHNNDSQNSNHRPPRNR